MFSILQSSPGLQVRLHRDKRLGLREAAEGFSPDLIVVAPDGLDISACRALFADLQDSAPRAPILAVLQAHRSREIFGYLDAGASDFLIPPLRPIDVSARVGRFLRASSTDSELLDLKKKVGLRQLVGNSPAFMKIVERIPLVARCDVNVLISGETGTGKELCARAVHYLGSRADQPFVPVNCGAIPVELFENELFGHERSAYTGASDSRRGLIREAEGGTLFLDEIDAVSLQAQVKLLRFLQNKEYRPLGSTRVKRANVRLVAATNCDPFSAVQSGKIRQDLYYRLNIVGLCVPPLRERAPDILLLARHFLDKYTRQFGRQSMTLDEESRRRLMFYDWPGNVRELEHVVERAVVLCPGPSIGAADIDLPGDDALQGNEPFRQAKAKVVSRFERTYIEDLLRVCRGNISKAAAAAEKNRRAFWELMRKHRIDAARFKSETGSEQVF